jgi:hypothetical protein
MVRKHVLAALVALAVSAPAAVEAQLASGQLVVTHPLTYRANDPSDLTRGAGGGFFATFTTGSGTVLLSDYLAWCIDPQRSAITAPGGASYDLYTAGQFVAANPFGWEGGWSDRLERTRRIASGVNTMIGAGPGQNGAPREVRNGGQIVAWDNFEMDGLSSGNPDFLLDGYYVLVHTPVLEYEGQRLLGQTYMFDFGGSIVPEPASILLMASAAFGLAVVARRRRA